MGKVKFKYKSLFQIVQITTFRGLDDELIYYVLSIACYSVRPSLTGGRTGGFSHRQVGCLYWDRAVSDRPQGCRNRRLRYRYDRFGDREMSHLCPGSQSPNLVIWLVRILVHRYIKSPQGRHSIILLYPMYYDIPTGIRKITATDPIVVPDWTGSSSANHNMCFLSAVSRFCTSLPKVAWGPTPRTLHWCRDQDLYGLSRTLVDTGSCTAKYPSTGFTGTPGNPLFHLRVKPATGFTGRPVNPLVHLRVKLATGFSGQPENLLVYFRINYLPLCLCRFHNG